MKIYRIFALLVICMAIPLFSACSRNQEAESIEENGIVELSEEIVKDKDIKTETVEERPVTLSYTANGEIKKNEDKFYTISSMVQGRIISAPVKLGDNIKEGQIVAYIQNPEIAKINASTTSALHENRIEIHQAKTRLKLAKQNYEREKQLYKEGITPKKDLLQAESDYLIAKDDLENSQERDTHIRQEAKAVMASYGVIPNFDTERLATSSPLVAMQPGIITKKNVTLGSIVTPEQILYEVTDMSNLWLDIVLYSDNIAIIKKGQKVEFIPDSFKDKVFSAQIDYIQPIGNDATQTYTARAFIDNKDGLLQPGMFGTVKIINDKQENKPFIPKNALQKYGKELFVFVDMGDCKYKKQTVEIAEQSNDGYFISSGVEKGDKIVTEGSFTLKSEMLKSEFAEED